MTHTPDITRPDRALSDALQAVGTATVAAELHRLGIRRAHLEDISPWTEGPCVAGPALTLQFVPLREDVYQDVEYGDVETQFHRHGCLRDWPNVKQIGIGCWIKGVTPNYHTQRRIFPYAVNVPIACGGCYVEPGDMMVADEDGAVVVPASYAQRVLERANRHVEWEEFSRIKLAEGGDLRHYYPLSDDARPEYEAWRHAQARKTP